MKKKNFDDPIIYNRSRTDESIVIQVKLKIRAADGKLQFTRSKSITVTNISFDNAYARMQKAFQ